MLLSNSFFHALQLIFLVFCYFILFLIVCFYVDYLKLPVRTLDFPVSEMGRYWGVFSGVTARSNFIGLP